jgi:AcrR family transcriptional regulator
VGIRGVNSDTVPPDPDGLVTMALTERKRTQRERLLRGMIDVANRRGYAGANVSAVIAEAGVSRPTFYEYFADREECLAAAITDVHGELLQRVTEKLEDGDPRNAVEIAVKAILDFADARGARARFLMGQSMSGGRPALDLRDQGIAEVAAAIALAQGKLGPRTPVSDVDNRTLVGSVYRLLATRLRRGEAKVSSLYGELAEWVSSYEVPAASRRWGQASPGGVPASSPHVAEVPIQKMPGIFPPGRTRASEAEIAENHRLRILYAVARIAERKGYAATTIADITKLARVDGRVFYRLFADKQEAFATAHELGFQQVMDVTTKAFFSAEGWPERSWEAGYALTQLLQANPLVTNVGFVEAYAVGASAVQRIEDTHIAFLFFLQEGLVFAEPERAPSRVAMEAIVAAIFEIIYGQARRGAELEVAGMLGYIAHLWLTPFLGPAAANQFIDAKLKRASKPTRRRRT